MHHSKGTSFSNRVEMAGRKHLLQVEAALEHSRFSWYCRWLPSKRDHPQSVRIQVNTEFVHVYILPSNSEMRWKHFQESLNFQGLNAENYRALLAEGLKSYR